MTQASTRKFAGSTTPCQSNAAAMRFQRSPPAATKVAIQAMRMRPRSAYGSRSATRGAGQPALKARAAASVRATCAFHSASEYGSFGVTASSSTSAVAGRWRRPLPRSSRRSDSAAPGRRTRPNGTAAASATSPKATTAAARPSGGSHSHSPSHDTVRKRPIAVASVASAGHSRSHKMVQWARRSAAPSVDRASGWARRSSRGWLLEAVSVTTLSAEDKIRTTTR